jgi:hypothetical protein
MNKKIKKNPNHPNLDMGRSRDDYKPEYCSQIIEFMKKGYSLASFGAEIRKTRQTLYNWIKTHQDFKEAHDIGKQSALKFFETMLINASMGIIPDQLRRAGATKLDVTAIIFALKTRFHQDYGEYQKLDHTSSDGSIKGLADFYKDHAEPKP